jgi:hypothetical protein
MVIFKKQMAIEKRIVNRIEERIVRRCCGKDSEKR